MLKTFRDYAVIFIISYQFLKVKVSVRRAKSFVSLVMVDILPFRSGSVEPRIRIQEAKTFGSIWFKRKSMDNLSLMKNHKKHHFQSETIFYLQTV